MEVSGQIRTTCPPEVLVSALNDPAILRNLMPEGSSLEASPEGRFAFSVSKSFGPVRLTLPGQLTMTPTGKGHDQLLSAQASHVIGGKVNLDLTLTIEPHNGQTRLSYTGQLDATGLAGRMLSEHSARVNAVLKGVMNHLKIHAEGAQRPIV